MNFAVSDNLTNSATAVLIRAAATTLRQYVTGLTLACATLGAAIEFLLRTTPVASTTATISSNTLVMADSYGWDPGDMVQVTASTVTGLTAGNYYYLKTVNGPNLTFAATRGGATVSISGAGVAATVALVLFRTQLQTTALPLIAQAFEPPLKGGIGQAIEIVTPAATTGRIDFNVRGCMAQ